jgi:cephalosporin-C deacetylase
LEFGICHFCFGIWNLLFVFWNFFIFTFLKPIAMNKTILNIIGIMLISTLTGYSQNLLSPVWKINSTNPDNKSPENVNLLLSWERQGLSWMSGNFILSNEFNVLKIDGNYDLTLALQCDVGNIYINDTRIGGSIPNSFWSERGKKSTLKIPLSCLKIGAKNSIRIEVSNLSYTGGLGHNICQLSKENDNAPSSVEMSFPIADHQFTANAKSFELKMKISSAQKGIVDLLIRNDYSDTIVTESKPVNAGETQLIYDLKGYNLKPGFYECIATLNNGAYATNVEWFTLSPEKIACDNPAPSDFDSYWDKALADLKTVEPNFRMHKVDSLCSANRDGFVAEMQSVGGITIRGYYFIPKGPGKFPAILHVPGYSYGFTDHEGFKNRKENVAELALCVRGHGISVDKFNPWNEMTLWAYKACDKEDNVYRSVFLDCVRAVEFLLSRPEIDTERIGVTGGSQGGGLTLATAALCNDRIRACAFFDPFPCDTRHQLLIRKMVKDELTSYTKFYNGCTLDKILEVQDYVDTKNFAGRIKCPTYFATSLFDDDCPPHMGFAAYNRIKSEKQFKIYPNDSHLAESDQYNQLYLFLLKQFGEVK